MLNQDSWDEALLGSEKKVSTPLPRTLLPGPNISKSLVPLAGLFLALTVASGFEFVGRSDFSLELPIESLAAAALTTQASAGQLGSSTLGGVKSFGQLIWDGYQSLGEVSLTALSQTSNLIFSEVSSAGDWGAENINKGGDKVVQSSLVVNQGLNVLATAVAGESKSILSRAQVLPKAGGLMAASIFTSIDDWYDAVLGQIAWGLSNTRDLLFAYGQEIGSRWRNFLGRNNTAFPAAGIPVPVSLDNETRADIKDIKSNMAEILKKLNQSQGALTTGHLPSEGMVVVPKVGNVTPDSLRAKVNGMFSDQINVALDESGKAGVITPIFRRGPGEDYLFVLTPITP